MAMTVSQDDRDLVEVDQAQTLCKRLMETKHYAKIGPDGVFAIVQKAKSLNMSPLDALNGGLYFVQGKVEMSAQAMNQLIRNAGHSIRKDDKSNNEVCILHGRRADNGDTWTESFSLEEARAAGLYSPNKPSAWTKYPRDMLFARSLSRLARQLFPDVIKGCYVQGEISDSPSFNEPVRHVVRDTKKIDAEQIEEIKSLVGDHEDIYEKLIEFMRKTGREHISYIEASEYDKVIKAINKLLIEKKMETESVEYMDEEVEDAEVEEQEIVDAVLEGDDNATEH